VIKSRRMKWAGHVEHFEEMKTWREETIWKIWA